MTPGRRLLRGARRRHRPGAGQRGRRPGRRPAGARRPRHRRTPRSPSGCCTSPTPRASRRSPRCGPARPPTRWPAACGGSTCCGPGCTPTRSASPREFEAGRAQRPGRAGRRRGRRPAGTRRSSRRWSTRCCAASPAATSPTYCCARPRSPGWWRPAAPRPASADRATCSGCWCSPSSSRPPGTWSSTTDSLTRGVQSSLPDRVDTLVEEHAGPRQPRVPKSAASSGHAP